MSTRSMTRVREQPTSLLAYTSLFLPIEARSLNEAMQDAGWRAAMEEEYHALLEHDTWELVPAPSGKHLIG